MHKMRYGAVITNRTPGIDLPNPIIRFLREIQDKDYKAIYDGDIPTTMGRHTGYHDMFEEWDCTSGEPTPEYNIAIGEQGTLQLSRI